MKNTFIKIGVSVLLSFFLASCQEEISNFASIEDVSIEEEVDFQEEIASLVESEDAIARGKSKKGQSIKAEDTVGQRDLEVVHIKLVSKEEPRPVQKPRERIDILFYLAPSNGSNSGAIAWNVLAKSVKNQGFFRRLTDKDWQAGISLFREAKGHFTKNRTFRKAEAVDLSPWESSLRYETYVLNAQSKKSDTSLYSSLFYEDKNYDLSRSTKNQDPQDILGGLDTLLSGNSHGLFRSSSKAIHVFMLDNNHFPYYTQDEWKSFLRKHKRLKLHVISPRASNVSNFEYALEKYDDQVDWTSLTDDPENLSSQLIELLK